MKLALSYLLPKLYRARAYTILEAECSSVASPRATDDEQFVVLNASNVHAHRDVCEALLELGGDVADYLEDLRRGRVVAFVILRAGVVEHYSYVFVKNKTACILGLGNGTALIGNDFTVSSYRGRGCQSRSVGARAEIARNHGFLRVVAETSPENMASQRGLQKGGMRLAGRMDLVVILNTVVIRWRRPAGYPLLGFCLRTR